MSVIASRSLTSNACTWWASLSAAASAAAMASSIARGDAVMRLCQSGPVGVQERSKPCVGELLSTGRHATSSDCRLNGGLPTIVSLLVVDPEFHNHIGGREAHL